MAQNTAQMPAENTRSLWWILVSGPTIWLVHFMAVYLLADTACKTNWLAFRLAGINGLAVIVAGLTLLAIVGAVIFALQGLRLWRQGRDAGIRLDGLSGKGYVDAKARTTFVAFAGMLLNLYSAVIILLTGAPALILRPCVWGG
jgi:hypothetical protein